MARVIAFLRGLNVGGKTTVAMADLRGMFADLGYEDARAVLQTGNVVFAAGGADLPDLAATPERETATRLGLKTAYLLRTATEWRQAITANPFPAAARDDPAHLVVMPLRDGPGADAAAALTAAIPGREAVANVGRDLFAHYPDGIGRSKLTLKRIERTLGTVGTGRNWNTALKVLAALEG